MKRTVIIVIVVIVILLTLKLLFFSGTEGQDPGKKGMSNVPVNVTAIIVKEEKLENKVFVTGTILANEEASLVPEISGKIVLLNLKEGSRVQKGQLLVKINDSELQAQLKKLKTQEQLAKDKESRQKKLADMGGISKEEYETTLTALQSIQADVEFVLAQISKTEIRAPFNGVVGLRNVSEGAYVTPSVVIASLQQIDPVKVDFSIPEKYARFITVGSSVYFSIEGTDEKYEAKVLAAEPKVDVGTRTIKIRAVCSNKQSKILPGTFAKIEMTLNETENSRMIPTEALIPILKGYKVFVSRNGTAEEVKVVAGLRTESRVQIISGLNAGDTVLTSGIMQLKNGNLIKVALSK